MIELSEAIAAYKRGDRDTALRISNDILIHDSSIAGAHFILGIVLADLGDNKAAVNALRRAVELAPDKSNFHITLGNVLLDRGAEKKAEKCFRCALEISPDSSAAHNNLATSLKRQGRLDDAIFHFRFSLYLLRRSIWQMPPKELNLPCIHDEMSQAHTFRVASQEKLQHDIEQYEYLCRLELLPDNFKEQISGHRMVLAELERQSSNVNRAALQELSLEQRKRLSSSFNRVNYLPPDPIIETRVLNEKLDYLQIEESFSSSSPQSVIVDDFLSKSAIQMLRSFCLEATIWFDCKENGGYLGAYMHEGFDSPLLLQLGRELCVSLPEIFRDHKLAQMWAFKYGSKSLGTRLHADKATINLNFWITPDEANKEPESGGLRLFNVAAPNDWHFDQYNYKESGLRREIARLNGKPFDIAYKCNRAVIFDSSLIHETIPMNFSDNYEDRRINITMLFGDRC